MYKNVLNYKLLESKSMILSVILQLYSLYKLIPILNENFRFVVVIILYFTCKIYCNQNMNNVDEIILCLIGYKIVIDDHLLLNISLDYANYFLNNIYIQEKYILNYFSKIDNLSHLSGFIIGILLGVCKIYYFFCILKINAI